MPNLRVKLNRVHQIGFGDWGGAPSIVGRHQQSRLTGGKRTPYTYMFSGDRYVSTAKVNVWYIEKGVKKFRTKKTPKCIFALWKSRKGSQNQHFVSAILK